jgi:hypothetical protein
MKKGIIIAGIISLFLSACTSTKLTRYNDDVYVNPKEEKLERERLAAERKKKLEEEEKKRQEELAAQKNNSDNQNPYYKDPEYNSDDYYDYGYASRIRRFNSPVYGLGYYDNYYTNYYWYNNDPWMYGNSIYNSYPYWGSGYNCYPNNGLSISLNYGYNNWWGSPYYGSYNPYGYWNNPYNAYWNGYSNGYYNGYYGHPYGSNGGWGYFNSFDVNSGYKNAVTYAPRGSHDGGNGMRTSAPGKNYVDGDGYKMKFIEGVKNSQETTPKFESNMKAVKIDRNAGLNNSGTIPVETINPNTPRTNTYGSSPTSTSPRGNQLNNSGNTDVNYNQQNTTIGKPVNTPVYSTPKNNSLNNSEPVKIEPKNPGKGGFNDSGTPNFGGGNKGGSTPANNAPSNSGTRNGGGNSGGGSRPR